MSATLEVPGRNGKTIDLVVANHAIPEIQQDPAKGEALAWCALDFRYFLRYWTFLDQETQQITKLGDDLWEGQHAFIDTMFQHDWIFALKARKLGFTTLAIAYDGWVARFRGRNERVHLFSRRSDAANEILKMVKFGLDRLPTWMKLPYSIDHAGELELDGGPDDKRLLKAYPADEDTAVEATATHGHVDEWARMRNPQRVLQAIEPSMAGTCHLILTGMGPANFTSEYWLMTMQGDTRFYPFFVKATMRPGRSEAWVERKRKELPEVDARREYPMTWKDSLYAGADLLFSGSSLETCGEQGSGLRDEAEEGHEYVKAWDIGRHRDAAVCTVWDVTTTPYELVHYVRLRQNTYPQIQQRIKDVHEKFPPIKVRGRLRGLTVIEDNAAGEAVRENLDLPEEEVDGHKTTTASKPRMIKKMEVAVANEELAWLKDEVKQFHTEMDAYQLPDDRIVQDSVMSACIALDYATDPKKRPRGRAKARVFSA